MSCAFHKVLVANRGEIACRVIESARAKGYRTVAVYSEADVGARHVAMADEAVLIGPPPVSQSYLDIDRIIAAAKRSGADAVHPGYGFLSEKAAFAEACCAAGLTFIGPSPEAIRMMGDKAEAKRRMIAAGVPCVPGYQGEDQSDDALAAEALAIGFPLMVKASAGGGGRGMRLVHDPADLPAALRGARSEAKNAFGDDRLLLERAIIEPRHVEIQVFGDSQGNIVHLGERDCSIQRRHQKVVEESPSPVVDAALRERMGSAAVRAAQAINYVGAGTIEFLLDRDGHFYFLEMNTRLQVEHPVTELVTGLDLVALQLDVAQGRSLPFTQDQVRLTGHAIEVRLYAEDASRQFLPQTGRIAVWAPAEGDGIRIDHGIGAGSEVSMFYDAMIAKIIAWGSDRDEARRRLLRAVGDTTLLGVTTNKSFLAAILEKPAFADGKATTAFIDQEFADGFVAASASASVLRLAAAIFMEGGGGGWRSSSWSEHVLLLEAGGMQHRLHLHRSGDAWRIRAGEGDQQELCILSQSDGRTRYVEQGHVRSARFALDGTVLQLDDGGGAQIFRDITFEVADASARAIDGALLAPMSGMIVAMDVTVGSRVKRGQLVAVVEAMKMEHQIIAPADGVVVQVAAGVGSQVGGHDLLVKLDLDESE